MSSIAVMVTALPSWRRWSSRQGTEEERLLRSVQDLSPTELENLAFDMLVSVGFSNLIWRTPGADGGRDIEGTYMAADVSGGVDAQKWYVECKRYEASIDWPTVWKKISYADSHEAAYLLIVTNSNPSPNCESEILRWNIGRHPTKVRFWRGYDIERLLLQTPAVSAKYGLSPIYSGHLPGFNAFSVEIMKFVQAAYAAHSFSRDSLAALEAAAALSELFSLRMDDVTKYGRMVSHLPDHGQLDYTWANSEEFKQSMPSVCLRALVATFRYLTGSGNICLSERDNAIIVRSIGRRIDIGEEARKVLNQVALWCDVEILEFLDAGDEMKFRNRGGK